MNRLREELGFEIVRTQLAYTPIQCRRATRADLATGLWDWTEGVRVFPSTAEALELYNRMMEIYREPL